MISEIKHNIISLLDDGDIDKDTKELLKNLCVNYVETFIKYSQEGILYGYNYNLYTFKYFNRNIRTFD